MNHIKKDSSRRSSFGTHGMTWVDRLGIWLSRRAILKEVGDGRLIDVLEIGCGFHALNLLSIRDKASSLTGIDFNLSPDLSDIPNFTAIQGNFDDVVPRLEGHKYDLVMMISVLEHLNDPLAALRLCRSLLREHGLLLINVPTWRGKAFLEFSAFKLGLSPREEMDDHKMYYDKKDLWPLLVKSGFKPSQICMKYHKFRLNLFASSVHDSR